MKLLLILCCFALFCQAQKKPVASHVWVADQGDGTYKNPVLYADYSDPDVVRVGEDYYLVASSFDAVPGLPVLHSRDLVNWELAGHVFSQQPPAEVFRKTQHGNGAWAPAIHYHDGEFYVFWPDPDIGIYMAKAKSPAGPWTAPLLVKAAKGWIDPCPLWDDDGRAYLINAVAASRSAMKSILLVSSMAPDGTRLLDDGVLVYDGHAQDPTLEGPKLYKRHGYYYILAPAGGVPTGWQLALRSKNIYGPYERKVVLAQGATAVNGPHQGGWVETPTGESWFLHFQDLGAWGRVLHLEPVHWVDDWPVMGDGGAPVRTHKKPNVGRAYPVATPPDSDDFNSSTLGLQWQWQANPQPGWYAPSPALGVLRLFCVPRPAEARNLWDVPNLLLQKFPAPAFEATAKLSFTGRSEGDRAGLIVMGTDYATLSVEQKADGPRIVAGVAMGADKGGAETFGPAVAFASETIYLRATVSADASVRFSYSLNGRDFETAGEVFHARPGRWIGAKIGLFATRAGSVYENGSADFDWFQVEPAAPATHVNPKSAGASINSYGH
jgi:beta-xylosidase